MLHYNLSSYWRSARSSWSNHAHQRRNFCTGHATPWENRPGPLSRRQSRQATTAETRPKRNLHYASDGIDMGFRIPDSSPFCHRSRTRNLHHTELDAGLFHIHALLRPTAANSEDLAGTVPLLSAIVKDRLI